MELQVAIVIGTLFATGVYLLMRRNIFSLLLGLSLLSHGINLFILASGRVKMNSVPVLDGGKVSLTGMKNFVASLPNQYTDPLPQALILTAIVISFAVTAFAAILVYRIYAYAGTESPNLEKQRME
ncbi:MAG: Na+/H+ antiporter subunit C [Armatimonadetes bacterium]|nr:Na+/H+ antiporter subunit C [Armatimonadota bacterium]MDW8029138.1 Na+/H+ antiporter subunit C [Armatimonadota bacterium]